MERKRPKQLFFKLLRSYSAVFFGIVISLSLYFTFYA